MGAACSGAGREPHEAGIETKYLGALGEGQNSGDLESQAESNLGKRGGEAGVKQCC